MSADISEVQAKIAAGIDHINESWTAAETPCTAIEAGQKKFVGAVGALATALELLKGAKVDFTEAVQTGGALPTEIDKGLQSLKAAGSEGAPQPVPQVTQRLEADSKGFKVVNESSASCVALVDNVLGMLQDVHDRVDGASKTTEGNLKAITGYRDTTALAYAQVYWQWHDSL